MNRRITGRVLAVFLAVVAVVSSSPASAAETQTQRAQRMAWWREARFGMFIHWGLYSIAAGHFAGQDIKTISSWTLYESEKPLATYTPLIEQFNPVDFDPNAWVSLAKEAGMKYMVLTSKHHEGFCLFDSAYTDFDVMSSPFKRDILKELVAAARRQGMRIGWYYSILDWNHPDYLPRRKGDERPTEGANFERYLEYMRKQLDEVLGNYGPIDVIWFDGEWDNTWNRELGWEFYRWIRQRYPNVIINNRIGGGRTGMSGMDRDDNFAGDFGTPEQEIPPGGLGDVDWETCMTMNDTWGFKRQDSNWKSTPVLVRMLIDCASKGGNLLLNVGPTARAVIPQPSVERLRQMGAWMKVNGESIYGTQASPFSSQFAWGRCTRRTLEGHNTRLFLHVFDWPGDGKLTLAGLRNKPVKAYLLAKPSETLAAGQQGQDVVISLPGKAPDPLASVVVLDIAGKPEVHP